MSRSGCRKVDRTLHANGLAVKRTLPVRYVDNDDNDDRYSST